MTSSGLRVVPDRQPSDVCVVLATVHGGKVVIQPDAITADLGNCFAQISITCTSPDIFGLADLVSKGNLVCIVLTHILVARMVIVFDGIFA